MVGADYFAARGVSPDVTVDEFKERWLQRKLSTDKFVLLLVRHVGAEPTATDEKEALEQEEKHRLNPRAKLRNVGVADGSSLLVAMRPVQPSPELQEALRALRDCTLHLTRKRCIAGLKFSQYVQRTLLLPEHALERGHYPRRRLLAWHFSRVLQEAQRYGWLAQEALARHLEPSVDKVLAWLIGGSPQATWPGAAKASVALLLTAGTTSASSDSIDDGRGGEDDGDDEREAAQSERQLS